MPNEYCGIIAASGSEVNHILFNGLRVIQHRGQEELCLGCLTGKYPVQVPDGE